MGEARKDALRLDFDHRQTLFREPQRAANSSATGLAD